ncbi:MAG: chorismate synthase [Bacteroidales bacterium]|nr:chorismate synthase [Bacteroidales bacterium]MCL2739298.1 chorismate synthase [Bacteroidales bacterium]
MNTFGRCFKITLFGTSHSPVLGVAVDGCPAGIALDTKWFESDLARRKAGALGTTSRIESDVPHIESGCANGYTTGDAIRIVFENKNIRTDDYRRFKVQPRPGHADWVARQKYGDACDLSGGGIFSGRMTLPLVAAGVIAKRLLQEKHPNIKISARLLEAGGSRDVAAAVQAAQEAGDSTGGIIECCVIRLPVGWGEPFFDSMESCISHIVFAVPGIKGIEFGAGFAAAKMRGSEHNDCYIDAQGHTATNHAGGINGGMSNGNELIFRVAAKPAPSIARAQETFDFARKQMAPLVIKGRHDVCFALRLPVVIEAVTAIALADLSYNLTGVAPE